MYFCYLLYLISAKPLIKIHILFTDPDELNSTLISKYIMSDFQFYTILAKESNVFFHIIYQI